VPAALDCGSEQLGPSPGHELASGSPHLLLLLHLMPQRLQLRAQLRVVVLQRRRLPCRRSPLLGQLLLQLLHARRQLLWWRGHRLL
jgi:hypothetical protein